MLTRYKGQLKLKDWAFAINDAKGPRRSGSSPRNHHARDVAERNRVRTSLGGFGPSVRTGGLIELPQGATPEGGSRRRRGLCCSGKLLADCAFNRAALNPAYPIKRQPSETQEEHPP